MNAHPIYPLIHRHLDGIATAEEISRLALALAEDPSAAQAYAQATRLEAGLRSCFQGDAVARQLAVVARAPAVAWAGEPWKRRRWAGVGMLAGGAAAAVLVTGAVAVAWRRLWDQSTPKLAVATAASSPLPRTMADTPAPPPSLRRAGELSAAARAVKELAARYWLPGRIELAAMPLEEALARIQQQSASVNHRGTPVISGFSIDVPEEVAGQPVTASRSQLPLAAWLELLSAQVGCELRYTESGVAFDPVEQPDRVETRRFPLASIPDPEAPAEPPARLFSYARPWDEDPDFRSTPPHGELLASAWQIPPADTMRVRLREDHTLEVRHSRRELRRIEGLVAVAKADASPPTVVIRSQEVAIPAAPTVATVDSSVVNADDFIIDLQLAPEVQHFEGFVNYGTPVGGTTTDAVGQPWFALLSENRIEHPLFSKRPVASGSRVVSNEEATGLLAHRQGNNSYQWGFQDPATINGRLPELKFIRVDRIQNNDSLDVRVVNSADGTSEAVVESEFIKLGTTFMLSDGSNTTVNGTTGTHFKTADIEMEPGADPWQQTTQKSVRLGESAWLATSSAPPVTLGKEVLSAGFSWTDLQPPAPLNATATLEGELIKLTGTYTPLDRTTPPTDFEAFVAPGQTLVLQTEDAPAAAATAGASLAQGWNESRLLHPKVVAWDFDTDALAAPEPMVDGMTLLGVAPGGGNAASARSAARGVVISPVLQWPAPGGK